MPSEGADALLSEASWLAEADAESSDEEERSPNAFPNDFVGAEITWEFLDKDLLSDEDLDQYSDWEDIPQNTSPSPGYDSSKSYERECMDNDINRPKYGFGRLKYLYTSYTVWLIVK